MDLKYIKQITEDVWKRAVFIGLIWLTIQLALTLIILVSTVLKNPGLNDLIQFSQFFLLLLSISFPVVVGYLSITYFPFNKVKKATKLGVGIISGTIFGLTIGVFAALFSLAVFLFASLIVGFFTAQSSSQLTVASMVNIFSLYVLSVSIFATIPLTIIFGAIYGSIGGLLKNSKLTIYCFELLQRTTGKKISKS